MACAAASGGQPATAAKTTPAAVETPRLIYNDDGFVFLLSGDDLTVQDLRVYLRRLKDTQVGLVAYNVCEGGISLYESKILQPLGTGLETFDKVSTRRFIRNRQRLRDEAGDYIGAVFSILREFDLPAVASIRMNDAHMGSDPTGPLASPFWRQHPEWRLGEPYGYYGVCLDYAVPEVRDFFRRMAREIIAMFPDIAGIELDGMRSPFFFKAGDGKKNAPLMTDMIRQIRGDLDEAAAAAGRGRYLLRVNVPRTPELALECGMDVAAWQRDRLVDGIAPGCYNTDFRPAIEAWRAVLGESLPIHAYLNCGPGSALYHSLEEYRGAAANAYGAGADGVYLFNVPCFDELSNQLLRPAGRPAQPPVAFHAQCWHPDLERAGQALHELGDPAGLANREKHYLFYTGSGGHRHMTQDVAFLDRAAATPAEMSFRCYDASGARAVMLELKTVGVTSKERFSFTLNGNAIPSERVERLHAPGGRDKRLHSIPLDAYSRFVISLAPESVRSGDNTLTVTLHDPEPDLTNRVDLVEMKVVVRHGHRPGYPFDDF